MNFESLPLPHGQELSNDATTSDEKQWSAGGEYEYGVLVLLTSIVQIVR